MAIQRRPVRGPLPAAARPRAPARSPASRRWCAGTIRPAGMLAPADFIPIAEESSLIIPIGEWVLRQACRDAARWPDDVKVAVNLSPAQFKRGDLIAVTIAALTAAGLDPDRLELEITESVLLHDEAWVAHAARAARPRSACASRWTISAPAIRASAICARSRSPRSRSTAASSTTWSGTTDALAIVQATIQLSQQARHGDHRRRRRDRRAARRAARRGLHPGARLPRQPADPRRRQSRRCSTSMAWHPALQVRAAG